MSALGVPKQLTTNNSHFAFEAQASLFEWASVSEIGSKMWVPRLLSIDGVRTGAGTMQIRWEYWQCDTAEANVAICMNDILLHFMFPSGTNFTAPKCRCPSDPGSGGRGTPHRRGPAEVRTRGSVRTHQPAAAHAATSPHPAAARNTCRDIPFYIQTRLPVFSCRSHSWVDDWT